MAVSEKRDANAKNPQDIINLICGVLLFISPWVANFAADSRAAWTGWIGGVVIAVMAGAPLLQRRHSPAAGRARWRDPGR